MAIYAPISCDLGRSVAFLIFNFTYLMMMMISLPFSTTTNPRYNIRQLVASSSHVADVMCGRTDAASYLHCKVLSSLLYVVMLEVWALRK